MVVFKVGKINLKHVLIDLNINFFAVFNGYMNSNRKMLISATEK